MKTHHVGKVAELKVALRCAELGWAVSIPMLPVRYDLVVERDGRLYRVQVKSASGQPSNASGSYVVELRRWKSGRCNEKRRYEDGEIDALAVYLPEVEKICWLPGDEVFGKSAVILRMVSPKNNQKDGIRLVEDYEI